MDTSSYYPQLSNDDPLFEIADYTQLLKTKLAIPLVTVDLINSDQVVGTNGAEIPIIWNYASGDTTMNPGANRDRLVAPVTGWYEVTGTAVFSNTTGGQRTIGFQPWRGGVQSYYRGQNHINPSASYFAEVNGSLTIYLQAGDYVKVTVEVSLAAASTSIKAGQGTRACMRFLRP